MVQYLYVWDVPMNLERQLSVEDSPNSAGVAIDSIAVLNWHWVDEMMARMN